MEAFHATAFEASSWPRKPKIRALLGEGKEREREKARKMGFTIVKSIRTVFLLFLLVQVYCTQMVVCALLFCLVLRFYLLCF